MVEKRNKLPNKPKKDRRIYISDLDGTLLRNDATLSRFTAQRLKKLIANGVNFTVATARSINSIREVLRSVPIKLPVIGINGAYISDYKTSKHLVINDIKPELTQEIYDRIIKHGLSPFVSAFDGSKDRLYYNHLSNPGMLWYYENRKKNDDKRLKHVTNLKNIFDNMVVALTVVDTYEKMVPLANEMFGTYGDELEMHFFENPYSPPWHWLTIHDKRACKSQAIKYILEHSGFYPEDLVVFGDSLNDVKMFQSVKHSIAVENATEQLKQHAKEIIGSNQQDSVVKYIIADQIKLAKTQQS